MIQYNYLQQKQQLVLDQQHLVYQISFLKIKYLIKMHNSIHLHLLQCLINFDFLIQQKITITFFAFLNEPINFNSFVYVHMLLPLKLLTFFLLFFSFYFYVVLQFLSFLNIMSNLHCKKDLTQKAYYYHKIYLLLIRKNLAIVKVHFFFFKKEVFEKQKNEVVFKYQKNGLTF